jgi:predicted nucleic acid-binding Zn ribbon protein
VSADQRNCTTDDEEIRRIHRDVSQRQYYGKQPQRIAEAISALLSRHGYAELESSNERQLAWQSIVGERLAGHSQVGNLRRGVLEIVVKNSAVVQELTFQKKRIIEDLRQSLTELDIRDIRFRVDMIE